VAEKFNPQNAGQYRFVNAGTNTVFLGTGPTAALAQAAAVAPVAGTPSDAIALAIRTHSNILATAELLDKAGIEMPAGDGTNQEVEKFREFLDQINPEDFIG
jgi:hypothetical protein